VPFNKKREAPGRNSVEDQGPQVVNAEGSSSCVTFAICCISGIGHLKAAFYFGNMS